MGALLESGLVGNIGLKHLKVIKEDTINKWDKSKLLANEIVSVQAMNLPIGKLFFFVPRIQGYQSGQEQTSANDYAGGGTHYAPVGSPNNPTIDSSTVGAGYPPNANAYSKNLYDLFYEGSEGQLDPPGLFDYSKGKWSAVTLDATLQAWNGSELDDYTITATTNVRKVIVKLCGFRNAGVGKLIGPDGNEIDNESFLSDLRIFQQAGNGLSASTTPCNVLRNVTQPNSLLFRVVTQQYGKGIVQPTSNQEPTNFPSTGNGGSYNNICGQDGCIFIEVDLSCPACVTCGETMDGYTGTTIFSASSATSFSAVYRTYENMEFEDQIGEVSFDLESVTVSVTERKLRAQWSPEMAQDVAAFHNIDAEAELTALLSEQVAAEIDREILRDLRKGAAWNLRWDYNGWRRLSLTTSYTQKDWNQTLITAINQLSAQIHKSTLRGGANWIVVSSEISAIFDDLEYFHVSNASPEQDQYNMGIERVGTLAGRYQVFRDPYFPPNTVLLGHKGTSLLDTGYIYAPYVPLQLTPTMYNPFNFTPIKGIMTRYAKKMVNNRFYGRITVDGVRTFDLRELR
jgi:hypothetical protein